MIRFFVLTGLIGGALVAYLTTAAVGPVSQEPPSESLLTKFREEGYLPETPNLEEDHEAEESGAFEVPEEDEARIEEAQAAFDEMMGGMDMGGMNMGSSEAGTMDMNASDGGAMKMDSTAEGTMAMTREGGASDGGTMEMGSSGEEGMTMAEGGDAKATGGMDMNASEGSTMEMTKSDSASEGDMDMSPSNAAMMGEGGLLFTEDGEYDREIVLTMSEWGFSDMNIDVKAGERIKFTVKNGGQIPHEFMFMSPPLMQAVNYRAPRADWSLLEHEALFEQALVLPGGEFSFVLQVTQPGSWMFMCMLPYHMQMGMMGQMATEGMAMDM